MNYLDISFVTPYYLNESSSEAVASALDALPTGQLVVSDWTLAEFASVLARHVRMQALSQQSVETTLRLFVQDAHTAMRLVEPVRRDFTLARGMLMRPALGLRTPDALHLAIAANRNLTLYTLDKTLVRAAQAYGVTATSAGILDS